VTTAGIAVALLPAEAYTVVHFGTLVPGHISTNANLIGGSWLAQRVLFAGGWLAPWSWHGTGALRAFGFWGVAPAAIVAVASAFGQPSRDERTFLWLVAGLTVLLVVLSAPNEGGGQWGPRYLLFAYVPLSLLAADLLQDLPPGWPRAVTLVALLAACLLVQRAGYRQLRGTKETYGRLVDFVRAQTTAGTFVVTDVWWLDQLAAAALDGRTVLFTSDAETGRNVVQRLSDRTVPSLTVIRSREASEDVDSWSAPTCYFEEGREELPVRGVVAIRLRHRCGYKP
jgi:hypothetical protein